MRMPEEFCTAEMEVHLPDATFSDAVALQGELSDFPVDKEFFYEEYVRRDEYCEEDGEEDVA